MEAQALVLAEEQQLEVGLEISPVEKKLVSTVQQIKSAVPLFVRCSEQHVPPVVAVPLLQRSESRSFEQCMSWYASSANASSGNPCRTRGSKIEA